MIQLKASVHAEQRIKERMNIEGKKQIKKTVKEAYHNGIFIKTHYIPKKTLKWIDKKVNSYFGRCSQWRIYKSHLFLFSKSLTLVTVISIPEYLVPRKELLRF